MPALAEYHSLKRHRLRNFLGLSVMLLFLLIYGFFFSAFAPGYFVIFMLPLGTLALLVIWALPEVNWAPTRSLEWLFYATFIGLISWPNYLALSLPGLPWITVLRLTSFPLVLTFLICLSLSANFRSTLLRSLKSVPAISILLGVFVLIQFMTAPFSGEISGSIQRLIVAQTSWTAVFFISAYVFLRPGQIRKWSMILWAMAIFVSLIAIVESKMGHVPWRDHIPGFLRVPDEAVQRALAGSVRAGTTRHRAQSTFSTPLGLGEYLALSIPFVLHFTGRRYGPKIRAAAIISIPLILFGDYLSDAKLGTIGALFGILAYIFGAAFQNWRRDKSSLVAASALFAYPMGLAFLGIMMLASHRFSVIILGNDGSHANSTQARVDQYTIGFQKIAEWPFGYGIGQSGEALGFGREIAGMITVDTYYLTILLEYGVAGFIVYYGMLAIGIYESGRRSLNPTSNEDKSFLLPIAVSLATFIVVKSVFSEQDNHPVVFMMLGALVAIISTYRKAPEVQKAKPRTLPRR